MQGWPWYSDEEIAAVVEVMRSGRVNQWTGEHVRAFEREFAKAVGARYAVALANGTVALEAALRALGIGWGDEVIVPPRSFIASASAVALVGARPVFTDVDRDSQNLDPEDVARRITPRTKAIVAVHLAGWPCEMDALKELADSHGLALIEDCAQAHGARYRERAVGSWGDAAAWSFCQDKIISTLGEGGMITTSRADVREAVWSWKDHGKVRARMERIKPSAEYQWVHERLGTNLRMTEAQAAVGRIQLRRLEEMRARRAAAAKRILDACASFEALRVPRPPAHVVHAWYRCYAFVRPERLRKGWDRRRIVEALRAQGVACGAGACPELYREQALAAYAPPAPLPVARELGETSIMFVVHPRMSDEALERIGKAIETVMKEASR